MIFNKLKQVTHPVIVELELEDVTKRYSREYGEVLRKHGYEGVTEYEAARRNASRELGGEQ